MEVISDPDEEAWIEDFLALEDEDEEDEAWIDDLLAQERDEESFYLRHRGDSKCVRNMFGERVCVALKAVGDRRLILHINDTPMQTRNLYVAKSRLVPHQWGLFANRQFRAGDDIVAYDGDRVSAQAFDEDKRYRQGGYFLAYPDTHVRDLRGRRQKHQRHLAIVGINAYPYVARNPLQRLAGFANHAAQPNAATEPRFTAGGEQLVLKLVALRDLVAGDEILWDYGDAYWDGDFIPVEVEQEKRMRLTASPPTGCWYCNKENRSLLVEASASPGLFCNAYCQRHFYFTILSSVK